MKMLVILACLSYTAVCQTNQEEANARANEGSLAVIGNLPRYGGDASLDTDDFSDPKPYLTGIVSLIAIPVLFVALSVLLCPFWSLCRCCQCCCCKKTRPKEPITKCQIYFPYFIVLASVIAIVAMAGVAYGANVDFSGALLYNTGEGAEGNLFGVAEELMSDGVNITFTIKAITIDIKEGVIAAIAGVTDILDDTSILGSGMTGLTDMLWSIGALWSDYNVTTEYNGDTYRFPCEFCSTFGATITNITHQIDGQIGPIFAALNSTVNGIADSLVDIEADIISQIDGFIEQLGDVHDQVLDAEDTVLDTRPTVQAYNSKREFGYNVIFAIPLLPIVFILFGGILKKPCCFSLSYICLWFSCTLMWCLLMFHLPIAVLLNDSCSFLDILDRNVTETFNSTAGEIFQACLTNERLTETLGVGAALNFTQMIEFPSLGNLTEEFQFSEMLSFEDEALSTNFTTFYAKGDTALEAINGMTEFGGALLFSGVGCCAYDRSSIALLQSDDYYTLGTDEQIALAELKTVLSVEALSIPAFNDTVYKIRANLSSVSVAVSAVETSVAMLANNVDNASVLLEPLFESVEDMIDLARCGFIGDAYLNTKSVMCTAVLGSLSRIVVSMIVIAVLSLFSCAWSIKLVRKVEWWGVQKREERDNKLKQSFQPNKPTLVVMQPLMQGTHAQNGYQPGNIQQGQAMYYNQNNQI